MVERHRFFRTAAALLALASLILTSCSRSVAYKTPKNKGYGPPPHAPAHGYRRKQQQAIVGVSGGALAGAGAGYVIINEQNNQGTQAGMDGLRQEMNVYTVNVTNSNGSISQVSLQKQGVGYVGPQGEFYDHLPTGEELQSVYGF